MLLFKYMKITVKSNLEYPMANGFTIIARFVTAILEIVGLFFLFERFNSLLDYSFFEVGLCYLAIRLSYALSTTFGKGFNNFGGSVQNGNFDSILIRPRPLILQVFGWGMDLRDFGVVLQYIVLLFFFVFQYASGFTLFKWLILLMTVVCGTSIFLGISMLSAACCFFSVKNLAMASVFTDGGVRLGSYPLTIYNKWITRFFTFIVPFGCANYLPVAYLTGRAGDYQVLYMLSPLLGTLFIIPCALVWLRASRHYTSTGS